MDDTQLESDSPADPEIATIIWKTVSGNGIEVSYDPACWLREFFEQFQQTSTTLLDHIDKEFALGGIVVGLLLCNDDRIRQLNNQFRGMDRATNVLSFSQINDDLFGHDLAVTNDWLGRHFFGEIAIAHETVLAEANELGVKINDHLAHLFVHGVLHLLGHDHENNEDANEMESYEVAILASVSIANPYTTADRDSHFGVIS